VSTPDNAARDRRESEALHATLTPQELRQEVASGLILDILQERRSERRWKRVRRIGTAALVCVGLLLYVASYAGILGYRALPVSDTVAVVPINGAIESGTAASADALNPLLTRLFEAEKVKGIVLLINSGGGSPSEAERITRLIDEQRIRTGKPVYAACSGMCASAAYLIALHTDRIYAGEYSWTGSIGAIMKGWDLQAVLQKFDIDQRVFASGSMKDLMNPFKPMTTEMRRKLDALVAQTAQSFIAEVKERRGARLDADTDLFSGEVWTGRESLRLGLVDEIGTLEQLLATHFDGLPSSTFVPKRRTNSFFEAILSETVVAVRNALVATQYEVAL
jgi:protease-4